MPEMMALKLLALVRRALRTTPGIQHTDRTDIYTDKHNKNEDWTKSGAGLDFIVSMFFVISQLKKQVLMILTRGLKH